MITGEPPSHLDLQILAAALRDQSEDLSMYAGFLLDALSAALPPELIEVRREGRLRARLAGREPAVLSAAVTLGDHRYELVRDDVGKPAAAFVRHASGGVVLSTHAVSLEDWSAALAASLAELARTNAAAAAALQRLTVR